VQHVPIHAGPTRVLAQSAGSGPQRTRGQQVIRVQPAEVLARRPLPTSLDGVGLAGVRLTDPLGQPRCVALQDSDRAVRRTAVENPIFEVRVPLQQHRPDGGFQELALIVRRRHDTDRRPIAGLFSLRDAGCPRPTQRAGWWRGQAGKVRPAHAAPPARRALWPPT